MRVIQVLIVKWFKSQGGRRFIYLESVIRFSHKFGLQTYVNTNLVRKPRTSRNIGIANWYSFRYTRSIKVQCFPAYSILKALNVSRIDYFSLDVEGIENLILKTLPLDKIDIDIFSIDYRVAKDKVESQNKVITISGWLALSVWFIYYWGYQML